MERLTMRDENGNACYIKYGSLTKATMEGMGVNKLADYEDAEEQGRLFIFDRLSTKSEKTPSSNGGEPSKTKQRPKQSSRK